MKHTPGPLPSSCLTCRQRRKKCDKIRPICDRCAAGGFRCLGYDHIPLFDGATSSKGSKPTQITTSGRAPSSRKQRNQRTSPWGDRDSFSREIDSRRSETGSLVRSSPEADLWLTSPGASQFFSAPSPIAQRPARSRRPFSSSPQLRDGSLALAPRRPIFGPMLPPVPSPQSNTDPQMLHADALAAMFLSPANTYPGSGFYNPTALFAMPPRISPDSMHSGKIIEFIISQYEPLFELLFFKPTPKRLDLIREKMIIRLQSSDLTHWTMYLGARIFQMLSRHGKRADLKFFINCLERIEEQVCIKSSLDRTLSELINSLSGGLEVILLNFLTSNTRRAYALIRKLAPTFLQIAMLDPGLWVRQSSLSANTPVLSLAHTMVSPVHELGRYAFMDNMASLVLGVAPLITYDTSTSPTHLPQPSEWLDNIHPVEWIHGAPPELIVLIVRINSWLVEHPAEPAKESDWRAIEECAWRWKPRIIVGAEGRDAWHIVTRVAIQEGWRHGVLIYLYLAMCGFATDHRDVRASMKQILQLLNILKSDVHTRSHFFFPVLIASICAPHERQRARLRAAFASSESYPPWLFKAVDCKAIIDHLWHGAAANGRAIRWSDYVASRKAMMPIDE